MYRTSLILLAFLSTVATAAQPSMDQLLSAMRQVESKGRDHAVGDQGRSIGPLQFQRDTWNRACRRLGVTWSYDKLAWDYPTACRVAVGNWALSCPKALAAMDWREMARVHNGGAGWRKTVRGRTMTRAYMYMVEVQLRLQFHLKGL